jgi:hypothetical protein
MPRDRANNAIQVAKSISDGLLGRMKDGIVLADRGVTIKPSPVF